GSCSSPCSQRRSSASAIGSRKFFESFPLPKLVPLSAVPGKVLCEESISGRDPLKTHQTDGVVTPLLDASLQGLLANTKIYDKPPVDLNDYGNAITYKGAIPAALDGSKTAVAQKNKLRQK